MRGVESGFFSQATLRHVLDAAQGPAKANCIAVGLALRDERRGDDAWGVQPAQQGKLHLFHRGLYEEIRWDYLLNDPLARDQTKCMPNPKNMPFLMCPTSATTQAGGPPPCGGFAEGHIKKDSWVHVGDLALALQRALCQQARDHDHQATGKAVGHGLPEEERGGQQGSEDDAERNGAHGSGGLGISQFRPDGLPVIWAKVTTRNSAVCGLFDSDAVNRPWKAVGITVLPLPDLCVALDADAVTKCGYREAAGRFEVVIESHENGLYSKRYLKAIAIASVADAMFPS